MLSSSAMLSSFDVEDITTEALLFQTGYLTIKDSRRAGGQVFYQLGYLNKEVNQSLNDSLLSRLTQSNSAQATQSLRLYDLLLANDFERLKQLFQSFFASIPHHWYTNHDIQRYEGFYASVFYSYFASLGLKVVAESQLTLDGGVVSVDGSVLDKPYSHHMALVGHFWSGKHHRSVKGINLITLYYTDPKGHHLPVNYRLYDHAEGKTRNDYFLEMLAEVIS